jgi:tellurium resistance protein TerD
MSINLDKGQKINLNKVSSHPLRRVRFGLGWKPNAYDGADFDLDATAFACEQIGGKSQVKDASHVIFYGNLTSPSGSITHSADNTEGSDEGDAETVIVDLQKLIASDPNVNEISLVATIYKAIERKQTFGQVKDSYIKAYNDETNEEIANFSLEDSASSNTAVQFGSLLRGENNEFFFKAVGQGFDKGLADFFKFYGLDATGG